jgi:hypothetical protein
MSAPIAIAVEGKEDEDMGRIRLGILPNASADSLTGFVQNSVVGGSRIRTDDWPGYHRLTPTGYHHVVVNNYELKLAHVVASLLKRWLLGTHQGAVSPEHLAYYLDEYTFRFNRRTSTHRGKLFMRLLESAVQIDPVPQTQIVQHARGRKPKGYNI